MSKRIMILDDEMDSNMSVGAVLRDNGFKVDSYEDPILALEPSPSLYENADFSSNTIRDSIKDGELKTNEILQNIGWEKCAL
jgi:hypothetical protein